jgi:hypothetical protein
VGDARLAGKIVGSFCGCREPHACHEDQNQLGLVVMALSGWLGWLANGEDAP